MFIVTVFYILHNKILVLLYFENLTMKTILTS